MKKHVEFKFVKTCDKLVICIKGRVSIQGVESLWGDCRFIPADWGVTVVDLCYFALFEDFSL